MANKAGRPKAKVSITFSEEELKTLIVGMNTSVYQSVEDFEMYNVAGMEMFGKEVLLLAKLRSVNEKKYGAEDGR